MDEKRDTGTVVDPSQLAAMALLERGLHPCIVELDEHGREVDRWGRVVRRSDDAEPPPSFTHTTEAHFENARLPRSLP